MIEGIEHIRDFRGIQSGNIEQFKKINLLVGPNNSGKSAILEAIYLTSTASQKAKVEWKIQPDMGMRETCEITVSGLDFFGDVPSNRVLSRHNYQIGELGLSSPSGSPIQLSNSSAPLQKFILRFADNLSYYSKLGLFSFNLAQPQSVEQQERLYRLAQQILQLNFNKSEIKDLENKSIVYCWIPDLSYNNIGTSAWSFKGNISSAQHALFYDVTNMTSHFPLELFRRMVKTIPGWTQKIAESFGRVLGINNSFNVQFLPTANLAYVQGWIAPVDKTAITIDSYGDGARNAFKVLAPLLALSHLASDTQPGVFIWEEPELFQNPQTLYLLLTEIASLIKNKPIQIFIATHSIEVVAYFLDLVEKNLIGSDELTTIRMNLVDGKLFSSEFNYKEVENWIEMRLDVRVPSGRAISPLIYQLRKTEGNIDND